MPHKKTDLIVALDFAKPTQAKEMVQTLKGFPVIYKVGLELFMSAGPDLVRELVHEQNRVFLDLKLHDIPNTVARAAKAAARLHVEMLTLHLSGGAAMFREVQTELADLPSLRPKLIGVTVLTSFDDVRWAEVSRAVSGHASGVGDSVQRLVHAADTYGVDGVVCSALELETVRGIAPSLYTIVPGIRPPGSQSQDQARTATPAQARELGASAIVVGRPITESDRPFQVTEGILKDLGW